MTAHRGVRHFSRFERCLTPFGQAMLEYLVIATIIIVALVAIQPAIQTAVNHLFQNAANQANTAASRLGSIVIP